MKTFFSPFQTTMIGHQPSFICALFLRMLVFAFLFAIPTLSYAGKEHIVATVNDEAITQSDVDDRAGLIFLSSGLEPNENNKKRVSERVLKTLIEERLQLQEAKRYDIEVSHDEIKRALNVVAAQNQMPADQLDAFFASKNIPKQTLMDQIKATLSWTKVIQRVLRPQVEVGEDEVTAALERVKANEGKPEYLLSEIFLSVENPSDDEKIKATADDIIKRLMAGAPFGAMAQQFSQGTGAISGGDMGWVQPGQLTGELDKAARDIAVGRVTPPIRMADGYHILAKRDERIISTVDMAAVEVRLKQASLPLKGRSAAQLRDDTEKFKKSISTCGMLSTRADQFPEWSVTDMGTKKLSELPRWLANLAETMPTNQPSDVMEKSGYAILLYVCNRNDSGSDRTTILNSIGNEKLELQARRLLRDLRRDAAIEMR